MAQADTARIAIWQTATVHDETGHLIATGGQWTGDDGQPITDPAYLKELEQRMASTTGDYREGDRVEILDDDGEPTGRIGTVSQDLGGGTYLIDPDDEKYMFGTTASGLRKADEE